MPSIAAAMNPGVVGSPAVEGQDPGWDPLEWMVRECHRRGMELHAWINPFRAKTKDTKELAANHPYWLKPDRLFSYDGLIIFDPGQIENQTLHL